MLEICERVNSVICTAITIIQYSRFGRKSHIRSVRIIARSIFYRHWICLSVHILFHLFPEVCKSVVA